MRRVPRTAVAALVVTLLGCDGYLSVRIKVVSAGGVGVPGALIQVENSRQLQRFTDNTGCADFGGVVNPFVPTTISIAKRGYQTMSMIAESSETTCLLVGLAIDGGELGFVERVPSAVCSCAPNSGTEPFVRFRLLVRTETGIPLSGANIIPASGRRWAAVTDNDGCLGAEYIVPAHWEHDRVSVVHEGYQSVPVAVPVMEDACFVVTLVPDESESGGGATRLSEVECKCPKWSGLRTPQ